jgi:hypothetical protein
VTVRIRTILAAVLVIVVTAGVGLYLGAREFGQRIRNIAVPGTRSCVVEADGRVVLNASQMANAATIAAVGIRRGVSERAIVVALATAFQESKLENLAGGDRDSIGLFQQRPSQGWGAPEQIRDPRYAATRFYEALEKVPDWERMRVTDAAQAVQRSAFPELYEQWADESSVLAAALLGKVTRAVACTVSGQPAMRGTAATSALSLGLTLDWGRLETSAPTGSPGLAVPADDQQTGWRYAHWFVSHATDLGVKRVQFGDLQWTAADGDWSTVKRAGTSNVVIAEVFDGE